jgi:protein subunit release factor A
MDKIHLPSSDEDLLALCKVESYRASGKGGQHVNTTDSAVRITYLPHQITVTCQEERSQFLNKMRCLEKLRAKVEKLNYRKPKRIPTKKPHGQKVRDLEKKTRSRRTKTLRKKINPDD